MKRIVIPTLVLAASVLAGCGSASQALSRPAASASSLVPANASAPLKGEQFIATQVTISVIDCNSPSQPGIDIQYSASGTATGPIPGTFTAGGEWVKSPSVRNFDEEATIFPTGKGASYNVFVAVQVNNWHKTRLTCDKWRAPRWDNLTWTIHNQGPPGTGRAKVTITSGVSGNGTFEEKFR